MVPLIAGDATPAAANQRGHSSAWYAEARLRELSPQADAATRTYAARFTIENADEAVAYGMTATVTLTPAVDAKVAKLPHAAVQPVAMVDHAPAARFVHDHPLGRGRHLFVPQSRP